MKNLLTKNMVEVSCMLNYEHVECIRIERLNETAISFIIIINFLVQKLHNEDSEPGKRYAHRAI